MRQLVGAASIVVGVIAVVLGVVIWIRTDDWTSGLPNAIQVTTFGATLAVFGFARLHPIAPRNDLADWVDLLLESARADAGRALGQAGSEAQGGDLPVLVDGLAGHAADEGQTPALLAELAAAHLVGGLAPRLLLVGDRGSGKTIFLRRVQQALLDAPGGRPDQRRVPVFARFADWAQDEDPAFWILRTVRQTVPKFPLTTLRKILDQRRVILLLDGLDEITHGQTQIPRASEAVTQLQSWQHPMALTCRDELANQMYAISALPEAWPVAQMRPLPELLAFNAVVARFPPGERQALRSDLQAHPDGALMDRLSLPLFLQAFGGSTRVLPAHGLTKWRELVSEPMTEENLAKVEQMIFDLWFDELPDRGQDVRQEGSRYTVASVRRFTKTLAQFVELNQTRTVGGDKIPFGLVNPHYLWVVAGVERVRLAVALLTSVMWLPLLTAVTSAYLLGGVKQTVIYFVYPILLLAFSLSLAVSWVYVRPLRINLEHVLSADGLRSIGRARLLLGLYVAVGTALLLSTQFPIINALVFGAGFYTSYALGIALAVRPDIDLNAAGLAGGLSGLLVGVAAFSILPSDSYLVSVLVGLGSGAVGLIFGALAGTLMWRATGGANLAFRPNRFTDPYFRLRSDLQTALAIGVISTVAVFLGAYFTPLFSTGLLSSCLLAVAAGIAAGPGLISVAWRRHLAMLLLVRDDLLPFELKAFLTWAEVVGIIRRSGAAYEFRHEEMRRYILTA